MSKKWFQMEWVPFKEKIPDLIGALISILIVLIGTWSYVSIKSRYPHFFSEKVRWDKNGNFVLIECKSPFGSWFKSNEICFKDDLFEISVKSILGNEEKKAIPHKKIKEVIIYDGIYWNCLLIVIPNSFFKDKIKLYFRNDDIASFLKAYFKEKMQNSVILTEKKTWAKVTMGFIVNLKTTFSCL